MSQTISAPGPLTIKLGDREVTYLITSLTPADSKTLHKFLREHAPKAPGLMEADLGDLSPESRRIVLAEYGRAKAVGKVEEIRITAELLETVGTSPKGAAFMVWLGARRNHPGLTLQEVQGMITEDNADLVYEAYLRASLPDDKDAPDPKVSSVP